MAQPQRVGNVLSKEIDAVKEGINDGLKAIVKVGYYAILDRTPVWSGSYLLSHRIGINDDPVAPAVDVRKYDPEKGPYPQRISNAIERNYREKAQTETLKLNAYQGPIQKIRLINQSDHALIVETTKGAPYSVAEQVINALTKQIESSIQARLSKV